MILRIFSTKADGNPDGSSISMSCRKPLCLTFLIFIREYGA